MLEKKFSKSEAIKFGWEITKENFWFFAGIVVVIFLIGFLPGIGEYLKPKSSMLIFLLNLLSFVLGLIVSMGVIKISLKFYDRAKIEFKDLFSQYPLFFKMLGGVILYDLIVGVGLLLFIVPGIIWAIKFWFYDYFIVDKKAGPIEALKRSSNITKGVKWDLFLFVLLLSIINLAGALVFLVGLFVTLPTTLMAITFVYRKLLAQSEATKIIESAKSS